MPPAKRRKTAKSAKPKPEDQDTSAPAPVPAAEETTSEEQTATADVPDPASSTAPISTTEEPSGPTPAEVAFKAQDRLARFRALQARAKTSSDQNLKEATKESQRLATDPSQLTALNRKHAVASHKLLKAEIEESGGDFERKRAWDWTIEESERWDKRMKKKEGRRDDTAFRDYGQESEKVYKRQVRGMGGPDLERYTREKMEKIEKAAAAGTLEIVETEDGELIAVDKDGSFYSTAESMSFAENKPEKAAVDRLVNDLKKAEEAQLKKQRDRRAANGDDGDVTYINEKNKQFNQKLARFYNKYTAEIRDSFERGTMI
ncbi:SYF2 splicing factor [Thozetella sp. PMI_491]|nr:SYF2 splicing factor [Thozetella sp. PMI_491]